MTKEDQIISMLIDIKKEIEALKSGNKKRESKAIQNVEPKEVDINSLIEEDINDLESEFVSDYVFRMQVKAHLNDDQRPQFFKASKISKKRNLPTVVFKNINPNAKVEFTTGYKRELLESIYGINEEV